MAMRYQTVTALAHEFGLAIGKVYWSRRYSDWPPGVDMAEAQETLRLLMTRIGETNFRRVIKSWESGLIEGIDV